MRALQDEAEAKSPQSCAAVPGSAGWLWVRVQSLVPLVLPHAQGSRRHPCCNHAARSDFAKAEVTRGASSTIGEIGRNF